MPSLFDDTPEEAPDQPDNPEITAFDDADAPPVDDADLEELDEFAEIDDVPLPGAEAPDAVAREEIPAPASAPPAVTAADAIPVTWAAGGPGRPAKRIRVMHFADVHLGVETYGKYNPDTGLNTRLEDFTVSLNQAIEKALESDVDIAVFAGDAYKARDPNQTHQRSFAAALKRLTDAGIPVAMLVGNHDIPNTRGRAHALEIYGLLGGAGVYILSKPDVLAIPTRQGDVLVAGMPYLTRSRVLTQDEARGKSVEDVAHLIRERYALYIAQMAQTAAAYPQHLTLLTGHFTVEDARVGVQGFLMNPNEPKVPASDVGLPVFDYVAMGHVHKPQEMNRGAQPPVVYSGSIDRIDFNERSEQKGFVLVDVRKGHADWKHVPLVTRRFLAIDADATQAEDPTRAVLEEIAGHPITGSVVKLTYKVAPDRATLVRTDEIRKALAAAHIVVALQRDMPTAEALVRSQVLTERVTPEKALTTYVEMQPRLAPRREELLTAARPLFEALEQEEALR